MRDREIAVDGSENPHLSSLPRNWTWDENQESQPLVHQGLEARSKIPWPLSPLKSAFLKESKTVETGTKFIFRNTAH